MTLEFTILTPTYNRQNLLKTAYLSLLSQTNKNFEWIIVDDGSTDETKKLVKSWIGGKKLSIKYFFQKNSGKHTALNKGIREAKGKYLAVLDSDDECKINALEKLHQYWEKVSKKGDASKYAGVVVLDEDQNGEIVGSKFPQDTFEALYIDIYYKFGVTGDKWICWRTDILKRFPFPAIEGEKFITEAVVWNRIGKVYSVECFNDPLLVADYQKSGLSGKSAALRAKNPLGAILYYQEFVRLPIPLLWKLRGLINYLRFSLHTGKTLKEIFALYESVLCKMMLFLLLPVSFLFYACDVTKLSSPTRKENRKIKILYLITGLNLGGAESVLYNLASKIDKNIFEPVVVSVISGGPVAKKIKNKGIKTYSLDAKNKFDLAVPFKLIKIIKAEKPDVIHAHLFHANILARFAGIFFRIPVISTIHNVNIGGKFRDFLIRATDFLGDKTVFVSKAIEEKYLSQKITGCDRGVVIYNGIKRTETKKMAKLLVTVPPKAFVLMTIARLELQKGISVLLDAMPAIIKKAPDIFWIVIGDGSQREILERKAKGLKITDRVKFLGEINNASKYLHFARIFVLPSLWEGLPLSLLEASSAGVPIVVTDVGGNKEVVKNGLTGILVKSGDKEALIEGILNLYWRKESERKLMGKKGKERVSALFSVERMVSDYSNLYREILEKN